MLKTWDKEVISEKAKDGSWTKAIVAYIAIIIILSYIVAVFVIKSSDYKPQIQETKRRNISAEEATGITKSWQLFPQFRKE